MTEADDIEPGVIVPKNEDFSDIEIARMIGRVLTNAANQLGLAFNNDTHPQTLCEQIILASQGGALDPGTYRTVWEIVRLIFKPSIRCATKRPDSLLDAAEHVTRSQQLLDAEPCHRGLGADGFEARYGESDAIRMALPNDVAQYLGGGEVDIQNTRRL